jgi:hypothetical protein
MLSKRHDSIDNLTGDEVVTAPMTDEELTTVEGGTIGTSIAVMQEICADSGEVECYDRLFPNWPEELLTCCLIWQEGS